MADLSSWEITLIVIPNAPRGSGWGAFFEGGVHLDKLEFMLSL